MTLSNTSDGGLYLRCKDDWNFIHSIDSHQMVEYLCASLEYFQSNIFLTFTYNTRNVFCKKPIREWLDDKNGQIIFPIVIHTLFYQQEIKRALHQSALCLFLRVLEEVSAVFNHYFRNSPSLSFLNMLQVFDCKEYQADAGNLSYIHLLGKTCQLYEQSRTELFDLIRNNVVDRI